MWQMRIKTVEWMESRFDHSENSSWAHLANIKGNKMEFLSETTETERSHMEARIIA